MNFCRETVAGIIDVFEDFLEKKGIQIENDEHTGDEGEAIIYGSDFDELMNGIIETLELSGIHTALYFDEVKEEEPEDLLIFVPAKDHIIKISTGAGGNLLKEDIEKGYVDYLNYDIYETSEIGESADAYDGGMMPLDQNAGDKYDSLIDAVPDILSIIYDNETLSWIEISGGAKFSK